MSHGMGNAKTYIGESHTCDLLYCDALHRRRLHTFFHGFCQTVFGFITFRQWFLSDFFIHFRFLVHFVCGRQIKQVYPSAKPDKSHVKREWGICQRTGRK